MTNTTSITRENSSKEPQVEIGLNNLPDEDLMRIVSNCDIHGATALACTNKRNHAIATDTSVWKAFAEQIDCFILQGKDERDQIHSLFADLHKKVSAIPNPPRIRIPFFKKRDISKKTNDIQTMITQEPTIDRVNHFQSYLKARDTLLVWKTLAETIDQTVPELDNLPTSYDIIAQASKFSAWFTQHQTTLSQISNLDLSNNQLTSLPFEISHLAQLTSLDLSNNQLTSFPPEIGQLLQLGFLNLNNNKLPSLPPEIGNLNQLYSLTLSNNQLTSLPPEINQLTQLDYLNLVHNQLTSLPPEIGQLTQLLRLNLSNNQLTALPPEIRQLTQLDYLDLVHNQLTSLPPEIGQLTQLLRLNLSNNQFSSSPPVIKQLTRCEVLLRGNPIPPSIKTGFSLTFAIEALKHFALSRA